MKVKKKLLVVGGGYGGTTLIYALRHSDEYEITLLNQTPFHIVQTEIHRYLGGVESENNIYFNLEEFCQKYNATFKEQRASFIDDETNTLICKDGEKISYDYLVIATGSLSLFPKQIENISEYSKDIKISEHLRSYQQEFDTLLHSDDLEKNIVIVGGGLTGVEIALEYANRLKRLGLYKHCKVSIIEGCETLLPGSTKELIEQSQKACDSFGIERFHGSFVSKIDKNRIYLSNGTYVPFSMLVLTIGVISESLHFQNKIEQSPRNQIIIEKTLHVKGKKNIFAIGDVAYLEDENGKMLLPTAQNAKQQAKTLAKTLQNIAVGKKPLNYRYKHKGVLVDLARKQAVGDAFGIQFSGTSAYSLKRTVNAIHTKMFR